MDGSERRGERRYNQDAKKKHLVKMKHLIQSYVRQNFPKQLETWIRSSPTDNKQVGDINNLCQKWKSIFGLHVCDCVSVCVCLCVCC